MGFLGGLFGNNGSNFQAQGTNLLNPTDQAQLGSAYWQTQGGLNQQQAFLNALQGQNGIGNQSNVFNQQQQLANQLATQAQGGGPNPALAQLNQATGQNVANQASLMAGQRGASANSGLIARQAAQQGANAQQQAVGQGATMRAQQQLAAQQALQGQQSNLANLASQQVGQQSQGLNAYNSAAQGQQGNLFNAAQGLNNANVSMQSNMNTANAGIAAANQKSQSDTLGGLLGGAGSAIGKFLGLAEGGEVPEEGPSGFLSDSLGKIGKNLGTSANGPSPLMAGANAFSSSLINGGASLLRPSYDLNNPLPMGAGEGIMPLGNQLPTMAASSGGAVPGRANTQGDSYNNDIVDAKLSPGEIVIPRSIAQHENAPEMARAFVEKVLASKKKDNSVNKADGGEIADNPVTQYLAEQEQAPNSTPAYTAAPSPAAAEEEPVTQAQQQKPGILDYLTKDFHKPYEEQSNIFDRLKPNPESANKSAKELLEEGRSKKSEPKLSPSQPTPSGPTNYQLIPASNETQNPMAGINPLLEAQLKGNQAYLSGLGQRMGGAQAGAKDLALQGQEQAAALQEQQLAQKKFIEDTQIGIGDITKQIADVNKNISDNKINPNQYLENMSTGGKVASALGMLVSGMGAGILHQENPVSKFLDEQIDRNIKSQQANLGKQDNLLSALMHQQGNMVAATNMMRALYKEQYADQLGQIAAKHLGPQAQAQAQQQIGQWKQEASQYIGQAAQTKALMQMNTNGSPQRIQDPSVLVRVMVPEHKQNEAYKEIKEQQNINVINEDAMKAFDKVSNLQTLGHRLGSPLQSMSQINAYWDPKIDKITKQNEGRVTPITVDMINSLRPSLRDNAESLRIKRDGLYALLNGERATPVLDAYRIPIPKTVGLVQANHGAANSNYAQLGQKKPTSAVAKR